MWPIYSAWGLALRVPGFGLEIMSQLGCCLASQAWERLWRGETETDILRREIYALRFEMDELREGDWTMID